MPPFALALGAVLLAQLAWLWPSLSGATAFYTRDILAFRLPYAVAFANEVQDGQWPLWSSSLGGGMPLWAHPSAELADPLASLFLWLPPYQAYALSFFLHMALATTGVGLLCRSLKVHPLL